MASFAVVSAQLALARASAWYAAALHIGRTEPGGAARWQRLQRRRRGHLYQTAQRCSRHVRIWRLTTAAVLQLTTAITAHSTRLEPRLGSSMLRAGGVKRVAGRRWELGVRGQRAYSHMNHVVE